MLCAELERRSARPSEHGRNADLSGRHVAHLGRRVHQLVDREKGEVPGHELDHRAEAHHRGTDTDTGKPQLGDGRVHHPHGPELVEQAAAHLVRALVHPDLLAHQEDVGVPLHLLAERLVEGITVGECRHVAGQEERCTSL